MDIGFLVTSLIVVAASIRRHVISRPRILTWMRRCFAGAFVVLGLRLALAER